MLVLGVVVLARAEQSNETAANAVELPPIVTCRAASGPGECIPFYLCNNNQYIVDDGTAAIDWRRRRRSLGSEGDGSCPNDFDTCCAVRPERTDVEEGALDRSICGLRKTNAFVRPEDPIQAAEDEFPWTVVILERRDSVALSNRSAYACVGSLIHPSVGYSPARRSK